MIGTLSPTSASRQHPGGTMTSKFDLQNLESRLFLSASKGEDTDPYMASVRHAANLGTPINLQIVALHEMGHSLGLDHVSNSSSIMYAYYNANYNVNNLANDPVVNTLKSI